MASRSVTRRFGRHLPWAILLAAVASVIFAAAHGLSRGSLNGSWIKASGDPKLPDQVTLKRDDREFLMKYFDSGGLATVKLICDNQEHDWTISPVQLNPFRVS